MRSRYSQQGECLFTCTEYKGRHLCLLHDYVKIKFASVLCASDKLLYISIIVQFLCQILGSTMSVTSALHRVVSQNRASRRTDGWTMSYSSPSRELGGGMWALNARLHCACANAAQAHDLPLFVFVFGDVQFEFSCLVMIYSPIITHCMWVFQVDQLSLITIILPRVLLI